MTAMTLSLPNRAVFTVPDAHEVDIECRSGSVWITLDHDRRDIVLSAGQHFRSHEHRNAVLEALEPSCLRFRAEGLSVARAPAEPARERSPWRLWPQGMSPA